MSAEYKPFIHEKKSLKKEKHGHLVPDGNPFKIANNSEMILFDSRKPIIETAFHEQMFASSKLTSIGMISPSNLQFLPKIASTCKNKEKPFLQKLAQSNSTV